MTLHSPIWVFAVLIGALISCLIAALPTLIALLLPPLIFFENAPFPVLTPRVRPGQAVSVTSRVCVNTVLLRGQVATRSTRDLVPLAGDLPTLRLPALSSTEPADRPRTPDGCSETTGGASLVVPRNTAPGMYYWVGTITWDSPLRHGEAHWRTQTFEVYE